VISSGRTILESPPAGQRRNPAPAEPEHGAPALPSGPVPTASNVIGLLVRLAGLAVLALGLWSGLQVIGEAWSLYHDPDRIERFALAVERGSHIDRLLNPPPPGETAPAAPGQPAEGQPPKGQPPGAEPSRAQPANPPGDAAPRPAFRMSYFVAWIVALFLLLLIGRVAVWLIKTGGELALYDTQMKRFARALLEGVRNR